MTENDERAVAYAVAETFNNLLNGDSRQGHLPLSTENIISLLYYNLNPWCTEGSFAFLETVCKKLEEH